MMHEENKSISPILPVFQRMKLRLRHMAGTLLDSGDDADDVLQDAFCRLWVRRDSIGDEDEAAALLTVTVRRMGIDVLRRRQQMAAGSLDAAAAEISDDAEEARAGREEQFRRVERLIEERLSPVACEVLRRKDFFGESFGEIAESMGMTQPAVRMQLSRARKAIRDCYREMYDRQ